MDPATLNDIGITLAGIAGVAIFYMVGKKATAEREAQSGQAKPSQSDKGEGRNAR